MTFFNKFANNFFTQPVFKAYFRLEKTFLKKFLRFTNKTSLSVVVISEKQKITEEVLKGEKEIFICKHIFGNRYFPNRSVYRMR